MKEEMENGEGSELSAVVGALLDTLEDKNDTVRESVTLSLRKIARHSPETVIHASVYYWELHRKIPPSHLASLLLLMTETLLDQTVKLNLELSTSVAELAVTELTRASEQEASELLVALSRLHCTQAMDCLLSKFEPEGIPPSAVVRALGMIASCNPFGMVPFIKLTLSVILPMLSQVHGDSQKIAFCFVLGKFAEAINDYIMNLEEAPDPGISKDSFTEEMTRAFDIFTNNWLKTSRNVPLAEGVLSAICPILPLLPEDDGHRAAKLIPILLGLCKFPTARLGASRAIAILLASTSNEHRELLRPFLEQLQTCLFEFVSVSPFEAFRDALLTHYEVLQCYRAIVILYPEEGLERILQHLRTQGGNQRARALVVLRHLINTLPSDDDSSLQKIALSLQQSLNEGSTKQMVGAIVALAAHPTLPLLPLQRATFIKYMVQRCGLSDDEPQAYEEALFLLATTVEGAELWLWPSLLKSLLDPTLSLSAVPVLRALSSLAVKIIRGVFPRDAFVEYSGTKVLARCLQLLVEEKNRMAVVSFLRSSAPLLGHQLKPEWDARLLEISKIIEESQGDPDRGFTTFEEQMVEFLEKSVELEGKEWAYKLSRELVALGTPKVAPFLAAITDNAEDFAYLVQAAKSRPYTEEYPRAVGIAAKRHVMTIVTLLEVECKVEDARKNPTRLLGLVRDNRATAMAEATKAALLRCYAELCKRGDATSLYPHIEKFILPWILKQLNECKETTTKEAGLIALEHLGGAVHPNRLQNSSGLKARSSSLATLLNLLQSHTGYRPLQLYPMIIHALISLLRIPPALQADERAVLLSKVLDKVIAASAEVNLILPTDGVKRVLDGLGKICAEVIGDSPDTLAELVEILTPWMQSKSAIERRTTLIVLRTSLRSYHDSLKYTYPGGKLEPGKLLGRILSWSADAERSLRPLAVDCVALSLGINARHRSTITDNNLNQDLVDAEKTLNTEDTNVLYEGVRMLAVAVCERIASGDVVNLAEGLVEGLLYRGESGIAAGICLIQLFKIRGSDIPRSDLYLVDNIIGQMRQMENSSCRQKSAEAIKSLTIHHPEEVFEHLLHQPLPLERGTEECWRKLGSEEFGIRTLDFLLNRLENNHLFSDNVSGGKDERHCASFPSLSAIVSLRHVLQCPNAEELIDKRLAEILSVLLKYLAGWLHVDAPMSIISTKFGFVPNRDACKLDPHGEVYSVLTNVLTVVNIHVASSLLNNISSTSESQADENLISTVRSVVRCLTNRNEILVNVVQTIGKLITSPIPAQRAIAAAFYAELVGNVDCGAIWLDAIINTLHEAKADSSPLVRKLATMGLSKISNLDQKQIEEYFDNCVGAMLDGLEEPVTGEGGSADVVLESLRGLSTILARRIEKPVSPRVALALKPFVEKDNWEMRQAAICALGSLAKGWTKSIKNSDDDVTDHLLGCLPCLVMKLEDPFVLVAEAARDTLLESSKLLQCDELEKLFKKHLTQEDGVEEFLKELVEVLSKELPQRAEELRNAVVRGYSRSESLAVRATAVLVLGYFGRPRAEDVQRMLQLLRDKEPEVKARAARALAQGFTT